MIEKNTRAIILAAGKSTRFKSTQSKLLFAICGKSLLLHTLEPFNLLQIPVTLVLGHQAADIQNMIMDAHIENTTFIIQKEQKGTGHAVACSIDTWDKDHILISYGDMPLVSTTFLKELFEKHIKDNAAVTFMTAECLQPTGYGRVLHSDSHWEIIEEKDCTQEQRRITCINAGIYLFKKDFLQQYIHTLKPSPITGELYLPALINIASRNNYGVSILNVPYQIICGVNTIQELYTVEKIKRSNIIDAWMSRGIRFIDPTSVIIDYSVQLSPDCLIGFGVHLLGKTIIGVGSSIGAGSIIENAFLADNVIVDAYSIVRNSILNKSVKIGPFAHVRDNCELGTNVTIGNFVETKNSIIGEKTNARHLTYLGDTTIGSMVNIGAGTITCNYDGIEKHRTIIENNVFIGSNNTIIAPIIIEKNSYTAAGSTITKNVPEGSLAIARSRQENKLQYAKKLGRSKKQTTPTSSTITEQL